MSKPTVRFVGEPKQKVSATTPKRGASRNSSKDKDKGFRQAKVDAVTEAVFAKLGPLKPAERGAVIARICGAFHVHPGAKAAKNHQVKVVKPPAVTRTSSSKKSKAEPKTIPKSPANKAVEDGCLVGQLVKVSNNLLKQQNADVKITESTKKLHQSLMALKNEAKGLFKDKKDLKTLMGDPLDNEDDVHTVYAKLNAYVQNGPSLGHRQLVTTAQCLRQGSRPKEIPEDLWKTTRDAAYEEIDFLDNRDKAERARFIDSRKAARAARKAEKEQTEKHSNDPKEVEASRAAKRPRTESPSKDHKEEPQSGDSMDLEKGQEAAEPLTSPQAGATADPGNNQRSTN
jgi:hypothetical protein